MRQRLPASLRAIERCLKLDDFDGQWCVPADLAKDHVGQFNDQLGITGDLGVEPTAGDAVCQLSAAAAIILLDPHRRESIGRSAEPIETRLLLVA
jgi:hypothetical protein